MMGNKKNKSGRIRTFSPRVMMPKDYVGLEIVRCGKKIGRFCVYDTNRKVVVDDNGGKGWPTQGRALSAYYDKINHYSPARQEAITFIDNNGNFFCGLRYYIEKEWRNGRAVDPEELRRRIDEERFPDAPYNLNETIDIMLKPK